MNRRWLFLDDSKDRHEGFARTMLSDTTTEVDHVWTATQAITAIRDNPKYDLIFLDHDLDEIFPGGEETGMQVAEFLALHAERDKVPNAVWVHSWNVPASENMVKVLKEAGIPARAKPYSAPSV